MTMFSLLDKMQKLAISIEESHDDAEKFDNGNASAGTRVRKKLLEVKKECDALRKTIQKVKNKR
jgi:hypothetical protein